MMEVSNSPPTDPAEPTGTSTSFTRRHWLKTVLSSVLGTAALVIWLLIRYRKHQRFVARETLTRLRAGGGRRDADGRWRVSSEGHGRFDDPEHYDFIILRGTEVTDADLACLPPLANIEWLDLSQTRITDVGLRHLKGMRQLRWLNLKETQVTAAGIAALRAALDHTQIAH